MEDKRICSSSKMKPPTNVSVDWVGGSWLESLCSPLPAERTKSKGKASTHHKSLSSLSISRCESGSSWRCFRRAMDRVLVNEKRDAIFTHGLNFTGKLT